MYGLNNISPSVNSTLTPRLGNLGAPGDMYVITDTRQRSKKDLDEIKSLQRYQIEKYDGSDAAMQSENGVILFPVKDLHFDTVNFQNRDAEFSETSVNKIIDAVTWGEFNWAIFDPITIWRNPYDGFYYVLSGHSRSEAFRRLSEDGEMADGRNFDRIPAKIFNGTFEQAKELALNSNTLSTKETDLERANYYRTRREKLTADGFKQSEIKKRLLELARKNEGKNATKIIYLSYLNPRGSVVDAVAATSDGASVDKNRVAVMAEWVGHLRYDFPQLTDFHESELFDFLKNGHYGVDVKNFNDFANRVQTAIEKHTEWGQFDADKSLNLEKNLGKSENEKRYDAELDRLKKEWADAETTLTRKLGEFKARQKKDSSITNDQILKAVQPYKDAAILAKGAYLSFRDKRGDYLRADENQMSLFGLGKPTIKLEFENNDELMRLFDTADISGMSVNNKPADVFNCPESLLQCRGFVPTYVRLASYDHLITPANGQKTLVGYGFEKATIDELINACRNYKQVERLAKHLKGDTPLQSAFNIWHFLHTNVRYDYDAPGEEEIRTPARCWADRAKGVDCDCLAVMTACLLINMGYRPRFEIVGFGKDKKFSHIYVNLDGAAIDRVLPVFLQRPDGITITKIMDIPVYQLSGCNVRQAQILSGVYANTLSKILTHTATGDDSVNFRKTQVLITLQGCDAQAFGLGAAVMPYVAAIGDDGAYYFSNAEIAKIASQADGELRQMQPDADFDKWLQNVIVKIKNAQSSAGSVDSALTAASPDRTQIVVIINPVADAVNVEGDMVKADMIKCNALIAAMLQNLKSLIAVNFRGMASRFAVGLMSQEKAAQYGYGLTAWQNAVAAIAKLKELYKTLSGSFDDVIAAVLNGAQKTAILDGMFNDNQMLVAISESDAELSGTALGVPGINGLGGAVTIRSAIVGMGEWYTIVWDWIRDVNPDLDSQPFATSLPAVMTVTETPTASAMTAASGDNAENAENAENKDDWFWLLVGGIGVFSAITAMSDTRK